MRKLAAAAGAASFALCRDAASGNDAADMGAALTPVANGAPWVRGICGGEWPDLGLLGPDLPSWSTVRPSSAAAGGVGRLG